MKHILVFFTLSSLVIFSASCRCDSGCENAACNSACTAAGHPSGMCSWGGCKCLSSGQGNSSNNQQNGLQVSGEWRRIKAGSFAMGEGLPSSAADYTPSARQHRVTLTHDFRLQAEEVSQGQFQKVMGYNPSWFSPNGEGNTCGLDCPVENVTWQEAAAYCNRLSERAGLGLCYTCNGAGRDVDCAPNSTFNTPYDCPGYRLPTEAEWEYAARAGRSFEYYNDQLDSYAWSSDNLAKRSPMNGGEKQRNPWGLYDMLGNVDEWCSDWQDDYPSGAVSDPWGPVDQDDRYRIRRGGSWGDPRGYISVAHRNARPPDSAHFTIGFRPARTVQ